MKVTMKKENSLTLDSYRGCAALVVAACHAFQIFLTPFAPDATKFIGLFSQASVMVFFILSGFLIGNSALFNLKKNGTFDVSSYAKSRALRIYPPLILSIFIMFILAYLSPFVFASGSIQLTKHHTGIPAYYSLLMDSRIAVSLLTFMNGFTSVASPSNAALWSLPLEIWYYAIVGLSLCRSKALNVAAIFILIFGSSINKIFILYGIVWFSGYMLSALYVFERIRYLRFNSPVLIFLTLSFMLYSAHNYISNTSVDNLIQYNISAGLLFFSIIYFMLQWNKLNFVKFHFTAKYSYTLYIIHFPIYLFIYGCFERINQNDILTSLLVAIISFAFVVFTSSHLSKFIENKTNINKILSL